MGNKLWTEEQEEYLKELYANKNKIKDITMLINEKFGTNFKYESVKRKIFNMGISNFRLKNPSNIQLLEKNRQLRVGQTNMSNDGSLMKIIEYNGANNILVEFQDEFHYTVKASYKAFQLGTIKNPGQKIICDRGYIGEGKYLTSCKINGKKQPTKAYDAWRRMFDRCYNENCACMYPTYKDSEVCKEWWDFQVFAEWFYNHYYEIGDQSMEVDKDWLVVGNKIYCPENCCIAPNIINTCLLTHDKIINFDLPIGVCPTASGKYKARCSEYGKRKDLGTYSKVQDAEKAYWDFKINYVEKLADKYKYCIPEKLYEAMMNFKNTYKQRYKIGEVT